MSLSTVARKKGRDKDIGEYQLSLPCEISSYVLCSLASSGILKRTLVRSVPKEADSLFFSKIHNYLYQLQC